MSTWMRYFAAIVVACLALVMGIAGVLALTVWKPAQEVVASKTFEAPFVMTRSGVLPLYDTEVEVTATAPNGDTVWIALGSEQDVTAWLADNAYEEVIGLNDIRTLKTVPHTLESPQSGEEAQSGSQSAKQNEAPSKQDKAEQAQSSGETAQSGVAEKSPLDSDMWTTQKSGKGSVTLTVKGSELDMSVLAATDGDSPAPTLTLRWSTPTTNIFALIAFISAGTLALIAAVIALVVFRIGRRRERRLATLSDERAADATDTSMIPAIALVEASEVVADSSDHDRESDAELSEQPAKSSIPSVLDKRMGAEKPNERSPFTSSVPEATPTPPSPSAIHEPVVSEPKPITGEISTDPFSGKRVETVSTDSAMINVSALRGGAEFPTRKALREARSRGVDKLVVGETEFSLGQQAALEQTISSSGEPEQILSQRSVNRSSWGRLMRRGSSQKQTQSDENESSEGKDEKKS